MSPFCAEVAKEEDGAAEPMEQGDEAEESESKETKPPAAVETESHDAAKPAEKEKGELGVEPSSG